MSKKNIEKLMKILMVITCLIAFLGAFLKIMHYTSENNLLYIGLIIFSVLSLIDNFIIKKRFKIDENKETKTEK